MLCPRCGNEIAGDACACGWTRSAEAPVMPGGVRCRPCGALNSASAAECRVCGAPLASGAVATPVLAPPPPPPSGPPPPPPPPPPPGGQPAVASPAEAALELPGLGAGDIGPAPFGKVLDRAFAIYRRAFVPLLLASALYSVPLAIVTAITTAVTYGMSPALGSLTAGDVAPWVGILRSSDPMKGLMGMFGTLTVTPGMQSTVYLMAFLVMAVRVAAYPFLWGMVGILATQLHLGRKLDLGQAWRGTKEAYWYLVAVSLAFIALITLGSCLGLLVVPLFLCAPWALLLERVGFGPALGRASQLAGRDYGRVLWWALANWAIVQVMGYGLGAAVQMMLSFGIAQIAKGSALGGAVLGSIPTLAQMVFLPVMIVFQVLLYFDLRARREGFDLRVRLGDRTAAA